MRSSKGREVTGIKKLRSCQEATAFNYDAVVSFRATGAVTGDDRAFADKKPPFPDSYACYVCGRNEIIDYELK